MRRSKKFMALALSLAIIMACAVSPTFSWLSSKSEKVVNTFAGGSIAVTLDEAQVDTDGKEIPDGERVTSNSYKYTAGSVLDKDPTPTILEGSDPCYVFIYVENGLSDLFTINYQTDSWKLVASDDNGALYIYKEIVDASDADAKLSPIFTTVTVSEDLTQDDIKELGEKTVCATAYAVQSDGLSSSDAIDIAVAQFMPEGTTPTYVTIGE